MSKKKNFSEDSLAKVSLRKRTLSRRNRAKEKDYNPVGLDDLQKDGKWAGHYYDN